MIVLHRLTTLLITLLTAGVFAILLFNPSNLLLAGVLGIVVIPILFSRLLKWEAKRFVFWVFLLLPMLLLLSAVFFFFFLEGEILKYSVGILVTLCMWLYTESVFEFYHLPSSYQAYTLEYLSLAFSILSAFFFSSGMYAMGLFMQLPIWVPAIVLGLFSWFASMMVLWVSKISFARAIRFSIVCAVCMAQVYIVLSLLPTSFLSNACGFAVFIYTFLGLSRAQALGKLSKTVVLRYLSVAVLLLVIIFLTARWI
ncbi:hypothetical protein KJ673_00050 [Patescibacteria group bacterium]|nr:hypothetical protein [Patescibacteria group bacterium]